MDPSAMKPPERPKQLDMLEAFVGNWTMSGEDKMGDKTTSMTGKFTCAWECDRNVLVEKMECSMGDMGKMSGMIVYSYDSKEKEFETVFFNNMGFTQEGDLSYDEKNKSWNFSGSGHDPMLNQWAKWNCTIRFVDSSTMEMTSCTKDMWGKSLCTGKMTAKRS